MEDWGELFGSRNTGDDRTLSFLTLKKGGYRILFLPEPAAAARLTLQMYPGQTSRARLAQGVLSILAQSRLAQHVRSEVTVSTSSPFANFLAKVCGNAPKDLPLFGVLSGNPQAVGRRYLFLLFDAHQQPVAVVKASHTLRGRELIKREGGFLTQLGDSHSGVCKVIAEFDNGKISATAFDYLPGQSPRVATTAEIGRFLSSWIKPGPEVPLQSLQTWKDLKNSRGREPLHRWMPEWISQRSVAPTLYHGDFTPWNLKCTGTGWTALDWERGEEVGVPCWDWFHHFLQTTVLVRKLRGDRVFQEMQKLWEDASFLDYTKRTHVSDIVPFLFAGYLIYNRNILRPTEGRDEINFVAERLSHFFSTTNFGGIISDADPYFSIVTPSYKQPQWLELCAASINDQRGVSFEHIVQDAKSDTGEAEILARHPQTRLYTEADEGMYDAINRGFVKARGQVLAWLNCDEQYLPQVLEMVERFFREHPEVDVVCGDALLVEASGKLLAYRKIIHPSALHTRLSHLGVLSCSTFIRRRVIDRGLLLKYEWKAIADAVWIVDMLEAGLKMARLSRPLAAFTITESNLGQSSLARKEMNQFKEQLPPILRLIAPAVIAWHRLRKLLAGAYATRTVATKLYTLASPSHRTAVSSEKVSFAWPEQPQGLEGSPGSQSTKQWIKTFTLGIALPLLLGGGVRWIDHLMPGITLTPLLCIVSLLTVAALSRPAIVAMNAVILTFVALHAFGEYSNILAGETRELPFVAIRFLGFLAAAGLAVLYSISRDEAASALRQLSLILKVIPAHVIISNATGEITYANEQATQELLHPCGAGVGAKWFTVFLPDKDAGSATRSYIELFADISRRPVKTVLELSGMHKRKLNAQLICLGSGGAKQLITVIDYPSTGQPENPLGNLSKPLEPHVRQPL